MKTTLSCCGSITGRHQLCDAFTATGKPKLNARQTLILRNADLKSLPGDGYRSIDRGTTLSAQALASKGMVRVVTLLDTNPRIFITEKGRRVLRLIVSVKP